MSDNTIVADPPVKGADILADIRGLSKAFRGSGGPVLALDEINLAIAQQEFVCAVGPSGCGKTTLMRLIAGIERPTKGEILLNGRQLNGPSLQTGVVFQQPNLLPWRSVIDNVLLPIDVAKLKPRAKYKEQALQLLKMVGVARPDELPSNLSGGMQQRVAICRALIQDPDVLLMDEPFGALDAMTREFMNLELLRIWDTYKKTVFLITHSIQEAVFLADRVIVLSAHPGRIVEEIVIDAPRPRTLAMLEHELAPHVGRIRDLLGEWEHA